MWYEQMYPGLFRDDEGCCRSHPLPLLASIPCTALNASKTYLHFPRVKNLDTRVRERLEVVDDREWETSTERESSGKTSASDGVFHYDLILHLQSPRYDHSHAAYIPVSGSQPHVR